mgnify:FL=1
MVESWNEVVDPYDTVYHLGDIAFSRDRIHPVLLRLNGRIKYLLGNHDKSRPRVPHDWECLGGYHEIRGLPQLIVLNHYGQRVWNKSHYGSWHLHGHSHGSLPPLGRSVDVGVDSPYVTGKAEYRPLSFDEIEAFMANQSALPHHGRVIDEDPSDI